MPLRLNLLAMVSSIWNPYRAYIMSRLELCITYIEGTNKHLIFRLVATNPFINDTFDIIYTISDPITWI